MSDDCVRMEMHGHIVAEVQHGISMSLMDKLLAILARERLKARLEELDVMRMHRPLAVGYFGTRARELERQLADLEPPVSGGEKP